MVVIVPEEDGRVVQGMLVAHDTQRCGTEHEVPRVLGGQAGPARAEDTEEMAVTEKEDATAIRAEAGDHAVGARTHRRERLTPRAAVPEEIPAWPLTADVGGEPAFIIAIVPLDEVRGDLGDGPETCKLASPPRPLERADQDLGERYPLEPCSQPSRVALAPLGQGDIGPSRVPARQRPRRLAVTGQVNVGERFVHGVFLGSAFRMASVAGRECGARAITSPPDLHVAVGPADGQPADRPRVSLVSRSCPSRHCIRHGAPPGCTWLDDTELAVPPTRGPPCLAKCLKPVAGWRGQMKTSTPKAVAT